ncbi:MAG: DNA methyltransferase [Armatimonadota bacterium]|nr:site-specific DNA-methyltransferase [Armatimonadota bacterium]MDW8103426.1 DNA methyltransferase [Armatimonadota bacterium]
MSSESVEQVTHSERVAEPKFELGTLAQAELPLSIPYQPSRKSLSLDTLGAGQEVEVFFRKMVSRIPSTTYGTFGLYRYPAKFIPQVVAYAIEEYGAPGKTVIDPFAGSGTTGLVARLYGLDYELWDLNPLLEVLHEIAILPVKRVDPSLIVEEMMHSRYRWLPQWSNLNYWYPEQIIPLLSRVWGYYHHHDDSYVRKLITVPLLKTTRAFSYNDHQRQKLSRSPKAVQRVEQLLAGDWEGRFAQMLHDELVSVLQKLYEYQKLMGEPQPVTAKIRSGVDSLQVAAECVPAICQWDILITSPPYLQAQEYIRCSKMDLFWLGYSEEYIRKLSKQELPYKQVEPIPVLSETYERYRQLIQEAHLRQMYERYFHAVLGTLDYVAECIVERMCLFVGPATVRGQSIPIDRIFAEHFVAKGWVHEVTFIDKIVARVMFRSNVNPATGIEDRRMPTEHLVILRRSA